MAITRSLLGIEIGKECRYGVLSSQDRPWLNREVLEISSLNIDGASYGNIFGNAFSGFYDGIRNDKKQLIGISMGFIQPLPKEVLNLSNPHICSNANAIDLYWGDRASYVFEYSKDQAFGFSAIFWNSESRRALLLIELDMMQNPDLSLLHLSGWSQFKDVSIL